MGKTAPELLPNFWRAYGVQKRSRCGPVAGPEVATLAPEVLSVFFGEILLAGRIISGLAFQAMGPYNEDIDIIIGGKRDCRTGPRKGWYVDMSGAKKRPPMEPITVRFSPKAMQALGQIADDN